MSFFGLVVSALFFACLIFLKNQNNLIFAIEGKNVRLFYTVAITTQIAGSKQIMTCTVHE